MLEDHLFARSFPMPNTYLREDEKTRLRTSPLSFRVLPHLLRHYGTMMAYRSEHRLRRRGLRMSVGDVCAKRKRGEIWLPDLKDRTHRVVAATFCTSSITRKMLPLHNLEIRASV